MVPQTAQRRSPAEISDAQAVHRVGVRHATVQCEALLRHGVPGIHFYTLNRSTATREILVALREKLGV